MTSVKPIPSTWTPTLAVKNVIALPLELLVGTYNVI